MKIRNILTGNKILIRLLDVVKDTLTYGFASVLGQLVSFLLLPLYTSYLTPNDYGILSMVLFISTFFSPLASLGMTNAVFRRFNLHSDKNLQNLSLSTANVSVFIISLFLLSIGIVFSEHISLFLVDSKEYYTLIYLCFITSFFNSIGSVFTVIMRAKRKVKELSIFRIISLVFTIVPTIILVVYYNLGVYGVIWGNLVGSIFYYLSLIIYSFNLVQIKFDFKEFSELFNYGYPFMPHRLFTYGFVFLGQYSVKEFFGLDDAGLFNIALKFSLPLTLIVTSIQTSWVPIKFQIHREEGDNARPLLSNLTNLYFVLMSCIFITYLLFASDILKLMTNEAFHTSSLFLPFVLLIPICQGIFHMLGTGFEITKNTKPMPFVSGTGFLVLGIIIYIFKDNLNITTLIFSIVFCWLLMGAIMRLFSRKRFYIKIYYQKLIFIIFLMFSLSIATSYLQGFEFENRILAQLSITILSLVLIFLISKKQIKQLILKKNMRIFNKIK